MIAPEFPDNEYKRQKAVESYGLLDTMPEASFDGLTTIISQICETPIALITLLDKDRNFLKSHRGIPFNESPRKLSFCGHAINQDDPLMIVEDAREDPRFHDNPLVTEQGAVFYAGATIVNPDGYKLGTICVYDTKPRILREDQKNALKILAQQVMILFDQILKNKELQILKEDLIRKNLNLEKFTALVSHDLKSPVNNLLLLTDFLKQENTNLSDESLGYITMLQQSSNALKDYINGTLEYYKSDELIPLKTSRFTMDELVEELQSLSNINSEARITVENHTSLLEANKPALLQIMNNLVVNAIKYNDKKEVLIHIKVDEDQHFYTFQITDNGIGIKEESIEHIFGLYEKLGVVDRFGNQGNGIGLATVQNIVTRLGGTIKVVSTYGKSSTFTFTIEKN